MSGESYRRWNGKISRKGEDVFRNADAALTQSEILATDVTIDDSISIPEPELLTEEHYPVGGGRNLSKLSELGFDVPEDTLPLLIQSAVHLYEALGACRTVGTALAVPFADVIASGQGTAVITMTTHTSMTPDEHIGRMLEDATSGVNYAIIDNDASTLTLHKATVATADGDTIAITKAPFIHTITESNSIPSQAFHFELENDTDAVSIRSDLLGVLMNTLEHIFEKKADGLQNLGILVAKAVAGSDLTQPANKSELCLNWADTSTFTLSYNSLNPITADECDSVTIRIANNAIIRDVMGDKNAKKPVTGIREYDLILHIFPENRVLELLRNTSQVDYITALAFVFKVENPNDATHYIQYTFNSLRVSDYKKAIPGKGDAERGLDCGFRLRPGGTLAGVASDSLNILHYER